MCIPPGEILQDELKERGWSSVHLARVTEMSFADIERLIHGGPIDCITATKLSAALGTSESFWVDL